MSGDADVTVLQTAATQRQEQEARDLRNVLSRFATGVTVLTTGGVNTHGMTANSFTSVSLRPPLVLTCVARTALMHEYIQGAKSYGVSVLGTDQERLARYFADRRRPGGIDQFDVTDWFPGPHTGAPLLVNSVAWMECALVAAYDGGDHSVFVGRVLHMGRETFNGPLLFCDGQFHHLDAPVAKSA